MLRGCFVEIKHRRDVLNCDDASAFDIANITCDSIAQGKLFRVYIATRDIQCVC